MRAVAYRVRRILRWQWRAALGLTLAVGIVTGVVLALAAGAERTATAPDRYTAASGYGFHGEVQQESGTPRTEEVGALPGVEEIHSATFLFGGLVGSDGARAPDALLFAGSYPAVGMQVVEGREPDPARPEEFVATRGFAEAGGVSLGSTFEVLTITQEQAARGGYAAFFEEGPQGPSFPAVLVGVIDGPAQLNDPSAIAVLAPSLLDGDVGVAATLMSVRLSAGTDLADFRLQLDNLPGGDALSLRRAELISTEVRTAVEAQAQGIWLLAAVGALAAVVVLGQLITRNVRLTTEEEPRLAALGFTRRQRLAESAGRAAAPVLAGAVLGLALAVSFSPAFPTGFVRRIEPHPGVRAEPVFLAAGAAGIVAALLVWTLAALLVARPSAGERPSAVVERFASRFRSSALSTGIRFAFTRSRRDRGSVGTALAGMVGSTALVVGAVVFGSSLGRLLSDGARYGYNFDLYFGTGADAVPDAVRADLEDDPDVDALMLYGTASARVDGDTLGLVALEPVRGELAPTMLAGRVPSAGDEVALGRLAAGALGVAVGDDLMLEADRQTQRFRVTGIAVVPSVEGIDGVGQDAVVTMEGLRRLEPGAVPVAAGIRLRPGAPPDTSERLALGQADAPIVIGNLARIRTVPFLVAGLVALLASLTLLHVVLTSVRNRRRDIAVLRSLGADRAWVARTMHWQATTFCLVPLLLGILVGVSAGRVVFQAFVDRIGAVPNASYPFALLAMVMVGFLVLANSLATLPARRARRLQPAPLLATE